MSDFPGYREGPSFSVERVTDSNVHANFCGNALLTSKIEKVKAVGRKIFFSLVPVILSNTPNVFSVSVERKNVF